ncbi:MAG: hypothetical protein WAV23_02065 [Minisyncoccia bacterium]
MTLDNIRLEDYGITIEPFLRNGIIIDTCVLYELINGLVETRISKKKLDILSEFEQINVVFDLLHVTQHLNKLYVTPHILTETCRHLEVNYNNRLDYKDIVEEVFPILEGMSEYSVSKIDFCKQIDKAKPIIESGDISIFVMADDFTDKKKKIAILTKDERIKDKYKLLPYVLVMDYRTIAYNMV